MKIYIDENKRCHANNPDGTFREIEEESFDGKCDTFIEGFIYDDSKGYVQVYPWKPYKELDVAQRQYEHIQLSEYKNEKNELTMSYVDGVNSI